MKEFTITVVSEKPPQDFLEGIGRTPAGPQRESSESPKKEGRISSVTLSARLVDVEYPEAQTLLEQMKVDAKKT